jgi:Lycopene cyclase protein/Squalene/phytoene synthase
MRERHPVPACGDLAASYERCRVLHRTHGRTYYLATRLLPRWKRRHVHALYGFTRYTDDLVDQSGEVDPRVRAQLLHRWADRFAAALREESAVLPPRARPMRRRHGRVLDIGARGGLIKASTGYGYPRIQRDSAAIAASLRRYGHPFALPRPRRRHRLLDAVLLDVLDRDPGQIEQAFARLFTANPAERVLRFLDEQTGILDELWLVASLPAAPYLRALTARSAERHR